MFDEVGKYVPPATVNPPTVVLVRVVGNQTFITMSDGTVQVVMNY